jgi:hypothetical protein
MLSRWFGPRWITGAGSALALAILIALVNIVPPLTDGGPSESLTPFATSRAPGKEAAYCRENLNDIKCICFARKAGHVMESAHMPIRGLVYADRWELARIQAGGSC